MKKRWEKKKLKEVCDKITDGTHQTPKYFSEGVIFLSSRNVTSGKINWDNIKYIDEKQHIELHKRVAPKVGDILLAKNGTTGVAAMVDRDVVFDIYVSLAHIRSLGEITPEFMLYFINSPLAKSQFNNRLKGIGVPNLHLNEIREVEISYPISLAEQKQIVAKLDKAFAAIDKAEANTKQNIANAKELFQSRLDEIFTIGANSKGWVTKKLGEVCELVRGPFGGSLKKNIFVNFGFAVYEQRHAIHGYYSDVRYFINADKYKEMKRFSVNSGDILMSCSGTIGKTSIIPKNFNEGIINQALLKISPNESLKSEFLEYYMSSIIYQDNLMHDVKGVAIKNVASVKVLKLIPIALPDNKTQENIVKELDKLREATDKLVANYEKKLSDLEELRKSLLEQAFLGNLS